MDGVGHCAANWPAFVCGNKQFLFFPFLLLN
jgi:hypothetical protein